MNDDLISRSALIERLKFKMKTDNTFNRIKSIGLESAIAQTKKAPAVDSVELVHGQWVYGGRRCSECGKAFDACVIYNFCPHCKAPAFNYLDGSDIYEILSKHCYDCGAKMYGGRKSHDG